MKVIREYVYNHLVQTTAEYVSWSTVEGVSLEPFEWRLVLAEQEAVRANLALEDIHLAIQVGEYQGRFGA